jgi:hypothetical protein
MSDDLKNEKKREENLNQVKVYNAGKMHYYTKHQTHTQEHKKTRTHTHTHTHTHLCNREGKYVILKYIERPV